MEQLPGRLQAGYEAHSANSQQKRQIMFEDARSSGENLSSGGGPKALVEVNQEQRQT